MATFLKIAVDTGVVVNAFAASTVSAAPEGYEFVERAGDNARVGIGFVRENGSFRAPTAEEWQAFQRSRR